MDNILSNFESKANQSAILHLCWTAVVAIWMVFLADKNGNLTPGLGVTIFIGWSILFVCFLYFRLRFIAADFIKIAYEDGDVEGYAAYAGEVAAEKAKEAAKKKRRK